MNWKSFKIILKSRFKKQSQEDWIEDRREICRVCPFNSKNSKESLTIKNKVYKVLSDFYTFITRAENKDLGVCLACDCPVFWKTPEIEEHCPKNKWQE